MERKELHPIVRYLMTQTDLARAVGVSRQYMNAVIRRKIAAPAWFRAECARILQRPETDLFLPENSRRAQSATERPPKRRKSRKSNTSLTAAHAETSYKPLTHGRDK